MKKTTTIFATVVASACQVGVAVSNAKADQQPVNPLAVNPLEATPVAVNPLASSPAAAPKPVVSDIVVNDVPLTVEKANWLRANGVNLSAGSYWYDRSTGDVGVKGGPAAGTLAPGLQLGGPLKADASKGNSGYFVNGRELTQSEATMLAQSFRIGPGRYAMDAQTNFGYEGQAPQVNLKALMMQMVQQMQQMQQAQQMQQGQMGQMAQTEQPRHKSLSERGLLYGPATFDGEGGVFIGSGSDSVSYHP